MEEPQVVGVIPAAGLGSRLGSHGYPKELLPITFDGETTPRPVVLASLEQMRRAGITRCAIVIAEWKLDLVRVLGERAAGVALAYVVRAVPRGLADALLAAAPWVGDRAMCLALPDTLVAPEDAIARVRAEHAATGADVVLGVFPTDVPEQLGPVRIGSDGTVLEVQDKPAATDLRNTWGVAVWSRSFTDVVAAAVAAGEQPVLGELFQRAARSGLEVRAVPFPDGNFLDVGTPVGLAAALTRR